VNSIMSEHDEIRDLLSLAAAGALDPQAEERIARHMRTCAHCAAELESWQTLARGLRRIPTPQPSAAVIERARARAELALAEAAEQRSNRRVLVLLAAFAWTLTLVSWPLVRVFSGGINFWFATRLPQTWYAFAAFTALAWLAGGAAAMILALHRRREGRLA